MQSKTFVRRPEPGAIECLSDNEKVAGMHLPLSNILQHTRRSAKQQNKAHGGAMCPVRPPKHPTVCPFTPCPGCRRSGCRRRTSDDRIHLLVIPPMVFPRREDEAQKTASTLTSCKKKNPSCKHDVAGAVAAPTCLQDDTEKVSVNCHTTPQPLALLGPARNSSVRPSREDLPQVGFVCCLPVTSCCNKKVVGASLYHVFQNEKKAQLLSTRFGLEVWPWSLQNATASQWNARNSEVAHDICRRVGSRASKKIERGRA